MAEQFRVAIPLSERIYGWLYDYHSGDEIGPASEELKRKHKRNIPFSFTLAGCPHKLVIHGPPLVPKHVPADYQYWVYRRGAKGDIEVLATSESEALEYVARIVDGFDPKKLMKKPMNPPSIEAIT